MSHDPRRFESTPGADLAAQAANLDALMIEVSLTAGRGTLTVRGDDDSDPELAAIRPLASGAAPAGEHDWQRAADEVIFGWLLSP